MKNGGYLHVLGGDLPKYLPPIKPSAPKADIDFAFLHGFLEARTTNHQLRELGEALGVSPMSLKYLGAAWDPESKAWFFPMRDETGKICGIRVRSMDGKKWAVTGSRQGHFVPTCDPSRLCILTEGITDCAAALTLGYYAIGRPSCAGGHEDLLKTILRLKIKEVVIVADNDEAKIRPDGTKWYPGQEGADRLQAVLPVRSIILLTPTKDLRSALQAGFTMEILNSMISSTVWTVPKTPEPFQHAGTK